MKTEHLSEQDIQRFAVEKEECSLEIAAHVQSCESCRIKVETYQVLFANLSSHPNPTFDFDLTALVMTQLPKPAPETSKSPSFVYFLLAIAILMVGMVLYPFLAYLSVLFTNVASMTLNLVVTTMMLLLLFAGIDLYFTYKKQIKMLNIQ